MDIKYNFHILDRTEKLELWDDIVRSIPSATIFHTNDWLFFVEKFFKLHLNRTLIYKDDKVHGVFPFFIKKYGVIRIAGSPLFVENNPYMGFALRSNENIESFLPLFNEFLKENRIDFFRSFFNNFHFAETFKSHGYRVEKKGTYLLDLSVGEELLWKNIEKSGRKYIKKAEKNKLIFTEILHPNFIDDYYDMSMDVYASKGLAPLLSKFYYQELIATFRKKRLIKIFTVHMSNGKLIAGAILLIYQNKAYGLDGVSFKKYQHLGINHFLRWNIIKQLKQRGVLEYDMCGGGDIPGIARFKKSLGANYYPTLCIEKSFSFFSKFARSMYAKKRLLKKKMDYYFQWKR